MSLERQNRLDMFATDGDRLSAAPLFSKGTLGEPGNTAGGRQPDGPCPSQRPRRLRRHRASSTVGEGAQRVFAGGENTPVVYVIDPVTGEPSAIEYVDTRGSIAGPFTSTRVAKSWSQRISRDCRSKTAW